MGMDMFYTHSTQLTQLHCHCIYTFPIALRYNLKFNPIKVNYNDTFVLPMIKVREKNGDRFDAGVTTLTSIVEKRMDLSLFENRKILDKMIRISGGCMWDLFRLIKDAADNALDYDREHPENYFSNISKIVNFIKRTSGSGILFCACNDPQVIHEVNQQVIQRCRDSKLKVHELSITRSKADRLTDAFRKAAEPSPKAIMVNNLDSRIHSNKKNLNSPSPSKK